MIKTSKKTNSVTPHSKQTIISRCSRGSWDTVTTDIEVSKVFQEIRSGKYKASIETIRTTYNKVLRETKGDKDKARAAIYDLKTALPCDMWDGRYTSRDRPDNEKGLPEGVLVERSGLYCADLDGLGEKLLGIREKLRKDRFCHGGFVSPSGDGLKPIFRVPKEASFEDIAQALSRHVLKVTGIQIDPRALGAKRLAYVSDDPEAWENATAIELPVPKSKPPKPKSGKPSAVPTSVNWERLKATVEADGRFGENLREEKRQGKSVWKCGCPSGENHKDVVIWLNEDGPVVHCFHDGGSCTKAQEEAQKWLRITWAYIRAVPVGWVHIVTAKIFMNVATGLELDREAFNNNFASRGLGKMTPAQWALTDPTTCPKYDHQTYEPTQPATFTRNGRSYFNLYRKNTDLKPVEGGDVTPWLDHARYIIPDERERETFLDWLAWQVQHPGEKILWATLLQGDEGIGKSFFGESVEMIVGKENVSKPSNDEVHEIYTASWARHCQLVIVEEFKASEKVDLMNRFRSIITQSTIQIRDMYHLNYTQPNVLNLLLFTNHRDAAPLIDDDRRYFVIFSNAKVKPIAYYEKLWDWLRANIGSVYHFLNVRDLRAFNPRSRAPWTKWKRELIQNQSELSKFFAMAIDSESWPFHGDIVGVLHLTNCLKLSGYYRNANVTNVGRALQAVGAKRLRGRFLVDEQLHRLRSVRRHATWKKEKAEAVVAEYTRWSIGVGGSPMKGNPLWEARPM